MLALAIFVLTLILVLWQPRGLGIGWSALGGAAIALLTGVVGWGDVAVVWDIVWDATFTFVGLILISLILDAAGVFTWAALHIARWGGGNGRRLFPLVVLLGALVSAIFANDGAALLLTPIVLAIMLRLNFTTKETFVFVIATGFIADTASVPFVISNLVNIVSANYFGISFVTYAKVMVPIYLVSVLSTLAVLWIAFGREIPERYDVSTLEAPQAAIQDALIFRASLPLLILLLLAYMALSAWPVPFSAVTTVVTIIYLLLATRFWDSSQKPIIPLGSVIRGAPWQIVLFSLGMYLVVYGLGQAGLTAYGVQLLHALAAQGDMVATIGTGFLSACVAAVMNNMPSTLIGALAIDGAQVHGTTEHLMVFANVIGNDLGPKFTPIGSLATLLWLHVLAGKGVNITWGEYMKVGLILTPPVLLITLIALALWLPMIMS